MSGPLASGREAEPTAPHRYLYRPPAPRACDAAAMAAPNHPHHAPRAPRHRFVQKAGVEDNRCLVFAHHASPHANQRKRPPKALARCTVVNTSFESPSLLKMEFDKFLCTVA